MKTHSKHGRRRIQTIRITAFSVLGVGLSCRLAAKSWAPSFLDPFLDPTWSLSVILPIMFGALGIILLTDADDLFASGIQVGGWARFGLGTSFLLLGGLTAYVGD